MVLLLDSLAELDLEVLVKSGMGVEMKICS